MICLLRCGGIKNIAILGAQVKFIRNILILLAGAIFMLHTVLPHEHHSELKATEHEVQHETANSLLDFLKLAFHMDQGEGHLEDYQASNTIHFNLDAVVSWLVVPSFVPVLSYTLSTPHYTAQNEIPPRYFSSALRFRGPPKLA
ncbi:MAG: hypothetical protein ACJA2S_002940 [Cyclobacteriaceae bacterium]